MNSSLTFTPLTNWYSNNDYNKFNDQATLITNFKQMSVKR